MTEDHRLFARIPAWFHDGRWVIQDGTPLTVEPGTKATFEIEANDLKTLGWQEGLSLPMRAKFLSAGTRLRVALSLGPPSDIAPALILRLLPHDAMHGKIVCDQKSWITSDNRFFEVTLGETGDHPSLPHKAPTGGLYLSDDGSGKLKVETGPIVVPDGVLSKRPKSLNHLLTLLSEVYEVHRASHTGNVFQRVFYEERDEKWYSLGFLRDGWNDGLRDGFHGSLAMAFWKSVADDVEQF